MFKEEVEFIKQLYPNQEVIPLHEPRFLGKEKEYLNHIIDTTFVSTVSEYVTRFENNIASYTGSNFAIATHTGTGALQLALQVLNVGVEDEVITVSFTFIGTANAIHAVGAHPIFVDIDKDNLGMSANALKKFLSENTEMKEGHCINKLTRRKIKAVLPVHIFGHPLKINTIAEICKEHSLKLIEDTAEALGSFYENQHVGTFGDIGVLSFNGNKIMTCGGGGMLLIQSKELAQKARHICNTAKKPHAWKYEHDDHSLNFRMPGINAALGCAQLEMLESFIENKRELAQVYQEFFKNKEYKWVKEPTHSKSNYWLNAIEFDSEKKRDQFLKEMCSHKIYCRPPWQPMHLTPMYKDCEKIDLSVTEDLAKRMANLPSSVRV